jgi:hypothetical protein
MNNTIIYVFATKHSTAIELLRMHTKIGEFKWTFEECANHLSQIMTFDAPVLLIRNIRNQRIMVGCTPLNMDSLIAQEYKFSINPITRIFDISKRKTAIVSALQTIYNWVIR